MRFFPLLCATGALLLTPGCLHVQTAPIEVKPIQVNVDVRIHVEKDLDSFFGALDEKSSTLKTP